MGKLLLLVRRRTGATLATAVGALHAVLCPCYDVLTDLILTFAVSV